MKKLLLLPLLLFLTGCVSYYYPETAIEDGVYYAEDDPAYNNNAYSYSATAYYPWWSMDYFYLGYAPYGGYGFGYNGYIGNGFSIGLSYGYSPWYYPYYSYYSPWYRPYQWPRHAYYPGWRRHRDYCRHYYGCGHKNRNKHNGRDNGRYADNGRSDRRGRDDDRFVDNGFDDRRNRDRDGEDGNGDPGGRRTDNNRSGSDTTPPVRRYVSTPPSGHSGNQGMIVRSREGGKRGKTRIGPIDSTTVQSNNTTSSNNQAAAQNFRLRSGKTSNNGDVRYRAGSKKGRTRTGPVEPGGRIYAASSPAASVSTAGNQNSSRSSEPTPAHRSRQGGGEVRYRSGSKKGSSRTSPVVSGKSVTVAAPPRSVTVAGNNGSTNQKAPAQHSSKQSKASSYSPSPARTNSKSSGSTSVRSHSRSSGSYSPSRSGRSESSHRGKRKSR